MAGHWRCTSSTGTVSQRSYVVTDGGPVMTGAVGSATTRAAGGIRSSVDTPTAGAATLGISRTVYGRQDGLDTGPFFERIVEHSDRSFAAQSPEGASSAATSDASSIRFGAFVTTPNISEEAAQGGAGRWSSSASRFVAVAKPLSLSYTLEPNGLRRIARLGTETLSDDRCTRDVARASSGVCSNPNAPAAALQAVQPPGTMAGAVQMSLVVDDRGQVVGENVISSSSPALTQAAVAAARGSRFTAAVQNCRAVSTQYTFGVQFGTDARRASSNGRETNL